jgi:hypothetical protein
VKGALEEGNSRFEESEKFLTGVRLHPNWRRTTPIRRLRSGHPPLSPDGDGGEASGEFHHTKKRVRRGRRGPRQNPRHQLPANGDEAPT